MPRDLSYEGPFAALAPTPRAAVFNHLYDGDEAEAVLEAALRWDFRGRIALVSSFGAEAAALLHMVAKIDRATPVLFLETGMLFPETLAYQQSLAARLGLSDLRVIRPDDAAVAAADPAGDLHQGQPDACCALRKTRPLERALAGFDVWITGRKRGQSPSRAEMRLYETDAAGRLKLNPLKDWLAGQVAAYLDQHDLPKHPLVAQGYPSIGCGPCTTPVAPGEDARAGRWRGQSKTECGIHFENGRAIRSPRAKAAPFDAA